MRNRFALNESEKTHIINLHGISALNEALFLEGSNSDCRVCDVDGVEYAEIDKDTHYIPKHRWVCGEYNGCNGPSCKDGVHTFSDGSNWGNELRGCCQKGAVKPEMGEVKWFDDMRKLECMCYSMTDRSKCEQKDAILNKELKRIENE
tara:strand:- start:998 stop:1441 length:444 start_codon:yes stop_codon:yes gene_type:complete